MDMKDTRSEQAGRPWGAMGVDNAQITEELSVRTPLGDHKIMDKRGWLTATYIKYKYVT